MAHSEGNPFLRPLRVALCRNTDRNDAAGAGVAQTTRPRDRTLERGPMYQIVTAQSSSEKNETVLLIERLLDAATGGRTPINEVAGEARRWLASH